jgi:N-acetyl-gamma-glutamyl-phosphate reductase common form
MSKHIPTIVLGGTGYVAAEIIGLLFNHPSFRIEAVVSSSQAGTRIDEIFPHLTGPAYELQFKSLGEISHLLSSKRQTAIFSALPHGETAGFIQKLLAESQTTANIVDVSADFRYRTSEAYEAVYGKPHPAPELLDSFTCALPDITKSTPEGHISHPGCFTTCVTLPLAALFANDLIEPHVNVSAITGSTGAGRQPGHGTHHPHRQSSMWAYQPLTHRHKPEMEFLVSEYEPNAQVSFVPHSGPFARGIHATTFCTLKSSHSVEDVIEKIQTFYAHSPFIKVSAKMPELKSIVGTNRCHIGVALNGNQLVITSVVDNLVKGAAGGAVQWMNRLFGLEEAEGLMNATPGWI